MVDFDEFKSYNQISALQLAGLPILLTQENGRTFRNHGAPRDAFRLMLSAFPEFRGRWRLDMKSLVRTLLFAVSSALAYGAAAQPTAFTFQGQLKNGGALTQGQHDFRLRLFDAASSGTQLGTTQCIDNIQVQDGVFTTTIDFGEQFATPNQRYIEILVRPDTGLGCADTSGFTTLSPRQLITPVPTSIQAASAFSLAAPDGSPARAVFVDNSGNVGIGTTTPSAPLHIASTFAVLKLQDTGTNSAQAGYVSYRNGTGIETAWIGFGTAGNPDFSIVNARSSGDIILNAFSGSVGIGTNSPLGTLNVRGKLRLDLTTNFFDSTEIFDSSGRRIWRFGNQPAGDPALTMFSPETGDFDAGMYREPTTGRAAIVGDVKNFRAPNPADPTTDIWYCCPEGPEAAMYIRGTGRLVNGRARVTLPNHFRNLAVEAGMTVQLTPLSADSKGLAVTIKRLDGIEVAELAGGHGEYEFDWRVEAVRRGYETYQVVRPWMRSEPDEAKAWQNRLRSIEQRRSQGLP